MDLKTINNDHGKSKAKPWSSSLSSIDTHCHDVISQSKPTLIKTTSETRLHDGHRESQPKIKCQNLNLTKVFAKIDNTYDRAQVATRQEEAKKKTVLYQRKVSAEIKVAQLFKVMKESAKGEKSHHWLSHKPKTPPPPSVDLLENYKELADELQHIENNLKETTERQQWTMKEIEANKTKNTKALRLLVEATEDLLHTSDPEDYAQSPHKEDIGMSPSFNARNLVSKTDDVIPSPKRDRVLAWKPSIFRRSRMTHRGSTPSRNDSSSNLISRSRMLKNSSFRKLFKPTDKDKNSVTEPAQPSPAKNGPNETAHPVSRLESTSRRQGRGKPIYSSATSSSDENEVRTEVSREALYEILVFEDLIYHHMKRARHYEFPFIDDV